MNKKLLGILIVLSIIGSMVTIILPHIVFASSMTGLSGYKTIGGNGQVSIGGGVPIVIGQNQVGGSPPSVTISAATNITNNSAQLNGNITASGGSNPTVTVYWGTVDGGQNTIIGNGAGQWQNSSTNISPSQPQGITSFYLPVIGLNSYRRNNGR